ncbi:MAG: 4-alpha-glucanotransferase, partial [Synergistaceae bacterium]|nr:4-alpha-glucanotransferase [Synergistaceae bacterium]
FVQFIFFQQMKEFRKALNELEIQLVGDVPIYTTLDCADVWVKPWLFQLDEDLQPTSVAGVPPDYFSKTGQLWGNPLYNWDVMSEDDYSWWMSRLRHSLLLFDYLRIDHFRGLVGYWSVPADEKTAINGSWKAVPSNFFEALRKEFPDGPFWAENLGIITDDVVETMKEMKFPGMIILHFAWNDTPGNYYAPHNHKCDNVIYTGTHDNNTTLGWFADDAAKEEAGNLSAYIGKDISKDNVCEELIRLALSSVADYAVIPMQDFLELGSESRFNKPSTASGNWSWRMLPGAANEDLAKEILKRVKIYGRSSA